MSYKFFCRRTSDKHLDTFEPEVLNIEYKFGLTISIDGYYAELSSYQEILNLSKKYNCGVILMDSDFFFNSLTLKDEESEITLQNHDISDIVAYMEIYDAPRE